MFKHHIFLKVSLVKLKIHSFETTAHQLDLSSEATMSELKGGKG